MAPKKKDFNKFLIQNNIVIIYLKNKNNKIFKTIIDIQDLERLISLNSHWYARWDKKLNGYYVGTTIYYGESGNKKHKTLDLHKFIINSVGKIHVDHINHDTFDNRRENLRISGADKNTRNRGRINKNNKSGYRNVCWIKNYWKIQLQINGKNYRFPEKFNDVNKAGEFAKKMREEYYGEFSGNG